MIDRTLEQEQAESGYQRTRIVLILFLLTFELLYFVIFLTNRELVYNCGWKFNLCLQLWLVFFLVYEGGILRLIQFSITRGKKISPVWRYVNSVIEVSLLSSIMLWAPSSQQELYLVDSPFFFLLYFLFIILSILEMDAWLSLLTAAMSAVQYALVIKVGYDIHKILPQFNGVAVPESSYYMRCIVLLISGLAAGFVAKQIKQIISTRLELQHVHAKVESLFEQQVSPEISAILRRDQDKTSQHEATVMALDIRNFTGFADGHTPDEIMAFQNKVFSPVIDIINRHHGIVNQILGDGIMATFGVPYYNADHANFALRACIEILAHIRNLSETGSIPKIRLGIGLHSGEVVLGNIGNQKRKQYSISGSTVIVAFRLEQLNKQFQSELLISTAVKSRLKNVANDVISLGVHPIKGFDKGLEIHKVDIWKTSHETDQTPIEVFP